MNWSETCTQASSTAMIRRAHRLLQQKKRGIALLWWAIRLCPRRRAPSAIYAVHGYSLYRLPNNPEGRHSNKLTITK
jgi:hypothetical protein